MKYELNRTPKPQRVGFHNLVGTGVAPVSNKTAVKFYLIGFSKVSPKCGGRAGSHCVSTVFADVRETVADRGQKNATASCTSMYVRTVDPIY